MLSLPPAARIWVATSPADMRKSFDGLCGLIRQGLGADPLSGALFVFHNKAADRVKILAFEGDGMAIWYKRLERGTFRFPTAVDDSGKVTVRAADLLMLLDGIDLESVQRRPRYRPPPPA